MGCVRGGENIGEHKHKDLRELLTSKRLGILVVMGGIVVAGLSGGALSVVGALVSIAGFYVWCREGE